MKKLFLLVTICIAAQSSVYAGPGRTGQTRQEALQLGRIAAKQAQHSQKLNSRQPDRFERRHFHWQATPSNSSKVLLFTLATLMLLAPTVTAFADKPSVDKSSPIYSKDYSAPSAWVKGPEETTFGACEKLADNATLCRAIGSNYTITSCIHPSEAEYSQEIARCCPDGICRENCDPVSRCLSYNLDGILGSQSKLPPVDRKAAYVDAEQKCPKGPGKIAEETNNFLKNRKYKVQTNFTDGRQNETTTAFGERWERVEIFIPLPDESKLSCYTTGAIIKRIDHPILIDLVDDLSKKMNVAEYTTPLIVIFNDETCDPRIQAGTSEAQLRYGTFDSRLMLMSSFLQKFSDAEIACVLAHELHHQRQHSTKSYLKDNGTNKEAEADIAALLATHSPCITTFLSRSSDKQHISQESFPLITSKNAANRLVGQEAVDSEHPSFIGHPSNIMRQAVVLIMDKHDKEATELLIADHDERIALQRASSSEN